MQISYLLLIWIIEEDLVSAENCMYQNFLGSFPVKSDQYANQLDRNTASSGSLDSFNDSQEGKFVSCMNMELHPG